MSRLAALCALTLALALTTGAWADAPEADIASIAAAPETEALAVRGTASAVAFKRAWLMIGEGSEPATWKYVGVKLKKPVRDDLLSLVPLSEFEGEAVWTVLVNVENRAGEVAQARKVVRLR